MSTLNYDKITLNDVPLDIFLKYFNESNYGDIINKPSLIPLTATPYRYINNGFARDYPHNIRIFFDKYFVHKYNQVNVPYATMINSVKNDANWRIAAAYKLYLMGERFASIGRIEENDVWYDNTNFERVGDPRQIYLFPLPTSVKNVDINDSSTIYFGMEVSNWFDTSNKLVTELGDDRYINLFIYKTYSEHILFRVTNINTSQRLIEVVTENEVEIQEYVNRREGTYTVNGVPYDSKKNLVTNSTYFPDFVGFAPYKCTAWIGNVNGYCTNNDNTCAFFLVETKKYETPEQDENGNNIYIDETGIKTLKATYANTFTTHQEALRRAMAKISSVDGWMNSKPANTLCILRKGSRYQLAAYNTITRTTRYTKVSAAQALELISDQTSYTNQMIPKRIVDMINSDGIYIVKEDEKVEHLYEYLDTYPRFKCYADYNESYKLSTLNPTMIRCNQLEDEIVTPEGFNAILDVYKRYMVFEDGTKIPLNKNDTVKLKLKINGKYLFNGKFMEIPIFNLSGKPFFVVGVSATNNEILKLSGTGVEIYTENKSAPIKGAFMKLTTQNVSNLKLNIPQLSPDKITFSMGDELGLSEEEIEKLTAYSGDSNYFLKFQSSQEVLESKRCQSLLVHIRKIIK